MGEVAVLLRLISGANSNTAGWNRCRTRTLDTIIGGRGPEPSGPAEVRNNYTDPYTKTGPLITFLRTLGINGEGTAALPAVKGYDDATGVGSPARYIQSY